MDPETINFNRLSASLKKTKLLSLQRSSSLAIS